MRREPHVRFCERAAVKFHRATHLEMTSPLIVERFDIADGKLKGKDAVRRY